MRKLIVPLYNSLGFAPKANDTHFQSKLRINAVNWACSIGIKDCIDNTKRYYAQWMADPTTDQYVSYQFKLIWKHCNNNGYILVGSFQSI